MPSLSAWLLFLAFLFFGSVAETTAATEVATCPVPQLPTAMAAAPAQVGIVSRKLALSFEAVQQSEGVGARVRRSIGTWQLRNFQPFLMLDHFDVKLPSGFPTHPHRGFETVTYMLDGTMNHEDFKGHRGKITNGEVQWMTAGKGILHAEVPGPDGANGLQLWVNLAASDKLVEPAYQEGKPKQVTKDGITAIVVAGEALGLKSEVVTRTPADFIHFKMEPNQELHQPIDSKHNSFVYMLAGEAFFGTKGNDKAKLPAHYFSTLSREDGQTGLSVWTGDKAASFVVISGKPLDEPVVQHGPFVMNTRQEIQEAIVDYQLARNGFERPAGWSASIDELMQQYE